MDWRVEEKTKRKCVRNPNIKNSLNVEPLLATLQSSQIESFGNQNKDSQIKHTKPEKLAEDQGPETHGGGEWERRYFEK